jgi:urease accessory protein UreH
VTDIVERLRERREVSSTYSGTGRVSLVRGTAADPLCREAADEIERLRAALEQIAQHFNSEWPERCQANVQAARRALAVPAA